MDNLLSTAIPGWVYAAVGGGVVAVTTAGVTIWHTVSRKRRMARAYAVVEENKKRHLEAQLRQFNNPTHHDMKPKLE